MGAAAGLIEFRLLDGPNLYFTVPAAKVTLSLGGWTTESAARVQSAAQHLGLPRRSPGEPGTARRQAFCQRLVRLVVRRLAAAAGRRQLAVRTRIADQPDQVVVAYPWKHEGWARAMADALVRVLADPGQDPVRLGGLIGLTDRGRAPIVVKPRVPVACITGTNGKTTTTRLLAHLCMTAGWRTGWSSTDGIWVQGELIEDGDYSGPAGGRAVLAAPGVQVAVLETARGGLLLRGMGVAHNDVSVVTNVSADHLGHQGVHTLDQLAEVKGIITRVTRPSGWTVLNGDDPRVWAMRATTPGRWFGFSLDPGSPALREALNHGGRGLTVMDHAITLLVRGRDPRRIVDVADVPLTLAGLSRHNLSNALAGAAAGLGLGIGANVVAQGLTSFRPDPVMNAGRMNVYTLAVPGGQAMVVLDMAHNEAGLESLLTVSRGLAAPGKSVLLGLGTGGDRTDEMLLAMGEMAAIGADRVEIVHKEKYLRGRSRESLQGWLQRGADHIGYRSLPVHADEPAGLAALVGQAGDGDVVAMMTHQERARLDGWLRARGGEPASAEQIRQAVVRNRRVPTNSRLDAAEANDGAHSPPG